MPRYKSYKQSEVPWLGNVPSHWDVQPLRAVTSLKSDKNRPDLPVLSVYREYGVHPEQFIFQPTACGCS